MNFFTEHQDSIPHSLNITNFTNVIAHASKPSLPSLSSHNSNRATSTKAILLEELQEFLFVSLLKISLKEVTIGKIIFCCGLTCGPF